MQFRTTLSRISCGLLLPGGIVSTKLLSRVFLKGSCLATVNDIDDLVKAYSSLTGLKTREKRGRLVVWLVICKRFVVGIQFKNNGLAVRVRVVVLDNWDALTEPLLTLMECLLNLIVGDAISFRFAKDGLFLFIVKRF